PFSGGAGHIEVSPGDSPIALPTLERLLCDCRVQLIGTVGERIVARTALLRTAPPWLARQIRRRDRHCRFPGCEGARRAQVHHLVHSEHDGPTVIDNLLLLCPYHHRFVHEMGWKVRGHANGPVAFIRPDGSGSPHAPPTLAPVAP